jgi:dienelactone hydrolase
MKVEAKMSTGSISEFQKSSFTATIRNGARISHDVYTRGSGPQLVIIQELPGIGVETLRLADKFIEQGFTVTLPHLFGPIGSINVASNLLRVFCMRREFSVFSNNQSSPIVDWLKALCRDIKQRSQSRGVGVIGMCLTGNFAISLMGDESVLAAVASQPAMPFLKQDALHMSALEIESIKQNIDRTAPIKAYRFEKDWMSTASKFKCIAESLNDDRHRIDLNTIAGPGHSVLTLDFVDEQGHPTHTALQEILQYFRDQLEALDDTGREV